MTIYLIIAVTPTYEDVVACFSSEALATAHLERTIDSPGIDHTGTIYRIDERTLFIFHAPQAGYNK